MPRVHHVKSARKDHPGGIKIGDPYYWWSTRTTVGKRYVSHKHYSKSYPSRSQLTSSEFLKEMYRIEDEVLTQANSANDKDDLESVIDEARSDLDNLSSEQDDKFSNLPEGLQSGTTGELLESRSQGCQDMISELESIDLDDFEWDKESYESEDEAKAVWVAEKADEITGVSYGGE